MPALAVLVVLLLPIGVAAQNEFRCWNSDEIQAEVENDTIDVWHLSALLNCCPDPITYVIDVGDATILVEEHSLRPCDCECCYDLMVTLANVPPGLWNLLYRWFDIETWTWTERVLPVEVPDVGQSGVPVVAEQWDSGCVTGTNAREPEGSPRSWGAIKAMYR